MRRQFIRIYAGIAIVLLLSVFGLLAMSKQWVASVRQADFEDKTQALIAMVREELEVVDVDPVAQLLVLNMFSLTHRMPITLEPLFVLPLSSAEKGRLKAGEVVTISIEERLQTYQMAPNGDVIVLGPYLLEEMIRWQDNLIEEGDGEGDGGNFFFQIDVLFFGILVAILLGIGVAIYFLIHPFERRIYALSDAAERFGRGDLSSRSPVGKGQAVADLARSFNGMADRIEGLVDGQRELLRAVSHELRTPLARIFFLLNQLKSDRVSGDQTDIQRIERSVYELNDLVEELMDFARLDRDISHRTEIDVYAQMRELREMVAELRGDISVDIDSEHLMVWANETHFKRALTNLVTNAVRHARHHIWIKGEKVDEMAHISVEDDGCGIPEHLREKVFEPFYRIDENSKTGGTGLGLAIVKRIVMQNDGQVQVQNRTEGGARFILMFPLEKKEPKTGRVEQESYKF
ncbi:MAG: HAMP domain-containing protein, partial [Candidatus Latescibacteria bacterium]|nr:HAMP domain-containing protein [Candidatus Latescibacterota bacterium]